MENVMNDIKSQTGGEVGQKKGEWTVFKTLVRVIAYPTSLLVIILLMQQIISGNFPEVKIIIIALAAAFYLYSDITILKRSRKRNQPVTEAPPVADVAKPEAKEHSVTASEPCSANKGEQPVNLNANRLHEMYLPHFSDMDSPLTEDDIVSSIALTHTFLTLTYLNPFPFEQDPVFYGLYNSNRKLFKDEKTSIGYSSYESKWRDKHNEEASEILINMAQENRKVFEHYHQMKNTNMSLALKPAFQIVDYARRLNNNYIVINYCYCLLKDKSGILNPLQISDLLLALGANSLALRFDEGLLYLKSRMTEVITNQQANAETPAADSNVPNTQGDETASADEQLLEQAENGALWAQKMLGFRYHSMGDYDNARKWLIKAALQGDVHSKILLMNTPS